MAVDQKRFAEIVRAALRGVEDAVNAGAAAAAADPDMLVPVIGALFDGLHEKAARLEAALLDCMVQPEVLNRAAAGRRAEVEKHRAEARAASLSL